MSRGRPRTGNRHVHIRVPEDLFAQLHLLVPEITASDGATRYGQLSGYVVGLIAQDLAVRRQKLLKLDLPLPEAQKGGDHK